MEVKQVQFVQVELVKSSPQTESEGRLYESRQWDFEVAERCNQSSGLMEDMRNHVGLAFPPDICKAISETLDRGQKITLEIGGYRLTTTYVARSVYVSEPSTTPENHQ